MPQGFQNWSTTPASNSNSDTSVNWAEGQAPSSVNDSARAVMARVREYGNDVAGSLTTGGTSTAYTVTTGENFTTLALLSGQKLKVRFNAASGAAPQLNVDALGLKPIQVASGVAVGTGVIAANSVWDVTYDNSIPAFLLSDVPAIVQDGTVGTQSLAANAVTAAKIANNTITGSQIANGTIGAAQIGGSFFSANTSMINGTLVQSQAANAMTVAVKTLAGADPSAGDAVVFVFRNTSAASGGYTAITVTAALSVTVTSGQTLGFVNATPGRAWVLAINSAGTVELAVINCVISTTTTTQIYPLQAWGIITTTAMVSSAAALIPYSGAARSSVAYVPLGYMTWETGATLATAGAWNVAPTRMALFQPGSTPLPGTPIQTQSATISTAPTTNSATFVVATGHTIAITPTSSANVILVIANGTQANNGVNLTRSRLSRGTTAATNMIGNQNEGTGSGNSFPVALAAYDYPATLSSQTYAVQINTVGGSTTTYGGNATDATIPAVITAQEIMG